MLPRLPLEQWVPASHDSRGVREHASDMTTSVLRGLLRDNPDTRADFFRLLQGMKGFNA